MYSLSKKLQSLTSLLAKARSMIVSRSIYVRMSGFKKKRMHVNQPNLSSSRELPLYFWVTQLWKLELLMMELSAITRSVCSLVPTNIMKVFKGFIVLAILL